jgi:hypothetical protein
MSCRGSLYQKLYKCSSRGIRACTMNCYTPTQKTVIFRGKKRSKNSEKSHHVISERTLKKNHRKNATNEKTRHFLEISFYHLF